MCKVYKMLTQKRRAFKLDVDWNVVNNRLPVRAILYGGKRLPFRAPRAKPAPNATQIAPTTANPMYNGQSEPATK